MSAATVELPEPGEGNADEHQEATSEASNGWHPTPATIPDVSAEPSHDSRQDGPLAAPVHAAELTPTRSAGPTVEVAFPDKALSAASGGTPSLDRFLPSALTVEIDAAVKAAVAPSSGGTPSLDRFLPSEPAVKITAAANATLAQWCYKPFNGLGMGIRMWPSVDAEKTGQVMIVDELFDVDEEVHGNDLTFLHLADGRGWVFDALPGKGAMCVRASAGL